ncbi:SET domain-containing protein [Pseudobythopirellula maris]|nr:SET domain-containing protein [Pseudobythopirellula maris]
MYPSFLPVVPGEPQSEDFDVVEVGDGRGFGLRVLRDFAAGEVLFRMNGVLRDYVTQYTLQVGPNAHLDDPHVAGKVLHCCEPNAMLDPQTRIYSAISDLRAGELVTMDYDTTEDRLYRAFECQCGAAGCRGYIAGRLVSAPMALTA